MSVRPGEPGASWVSNGTRDTRAFIQILLLLPSGLHEERPHNVHSSVTADRKCYDGPERSMYKSETRGCPMAQGDVHPLATLVRRYRLSAGLSQEELAERSGLSARTISDLERGLSAAPRPDTIRMLAKG